MEAQLAAGWRDAAEKRQGSRQPMSRRVGLIPLICLVLLGTSVGCRSVSSGEVTAAPAAGLKATIDAPSRLTVGERVRVGFSLTNTADTTLYVLKWYTPLEGIAGEIFRVTRDGQPVSYEGILATRIAPSAEAYVALEPGVAASAEVDLATAYGFSEPGTYTIQFNSPRISHVAGTETEMVSSLDDLGPVHIPCNTVTVEVGGLQVASEQRSSDEVEGMVRDYVRAQKPDLAPQLSLGLEAVAVPGAWERLRAQVFRVTDGPFARETLLVQEQTVLPLGTAFGGQGVTSLVVADLDRDGIAELLFSYGFGSGIHQSRVGMFAPAYSTGRTFEAGIVYRGDVGLSREDTSTVSVRIVEPDDETLTLLYLETLGYLRIKQHDERVALALDVSDDLPDALRENLMRAETGAQ